MPYTTGFKNNASLNHHYAKHKGEFGLISIAEYASMADEFIGAPLGEGTLECVRVGGDILRYNPKTEEYAVMSKNQEILTYFIPVPLIKHRFATNEEYFRDECKRVF